MIVIVVLLYFASLLSRINFTMFYVFLIKHGKLTHYVSFEPLTFNLSAL